MHPAIFLCAETTRPVLNNCLLRKVADKQLIVRHTVECTTALFKKCIGIFEENFHAVLDVNVGAVVDDMVEIIGIIVMSHMTNQIIVTVLMKIADQLCDASVKKFHTAEPAYI